MIVLCVVYRTMFTPGALFSVCFTEQCLLLELCSHDCSLCGLQNNAYYWSFGLMIVLWFTEQWLLLGLHSFCGLLHQPPPVHTTRLVACLPLSSFPAMFYCFSLSFVVFPLSFIVFPLSFVVLFLFFLFLLLFFLFLLLFFLFLLLFFLFLLLFLTIIGS